MSGIFVLVTIYSFIQELVFRYITSGNTGIHKYLVYGYIVGSNKKITFRFCWMIVWSLGRSLTKGVVHCLVFVPLFFHFCFVSFHFWWTIFRRLDCWLTTHGILHRSVSVTFSFRFIFVPFRFCSVSFRYCCHSILFCFQYTLAHNALLVIVIS